MITTQCLMSKHSSDSISNRLAQTGKNTSQKKYITRLEGHNNSDQLCDMENLPIDLLESWPYKESLHNRIGLINYRNCNIKVMDQCMQKEVYILSRPSKLQPMLPDCGTPARSFCSHLGGVGFECFFCNCARGLYFSGYALMSCDFGECCESVP